MDPVSLSCSFNFYVLDLRFSYACFFFFNPCAQLVLYKRSLLCFVVDKERNGNGRHESNKDFFGPGARGLRNITNKNPIQQRQS